MKLNFLKATAFTLALTLGALAPVGATDTDTSYMQVLSDIPLAPGLSLEDESSVVFDGADGKIVQVVAFGPVDLKEIKYFYETSLEALGWQKVGKAPWSFKRDEEALELTFKESTENAGEDVEAIVEVHFKFTSSVK